MDYPEKWRISCDVQDTVNRQQDTQTIWLQVLLWYNFQFLHCLENWQVMMTHGPPLYSTTTCIQFYSRHTVGYKFNVNKYLFHITTYYIFFHNYIYYSLKKKIHTVLYHITAYITYSYIYIITYYYTLNTTIHIYYYILLQYILHILTSSTCILHKLFHIITYYILLFYILHIYTYYCTFLYHYHSKA